jgi:stage II sporulation protein R
MDMKFVRKYWLEIVYIYSVILFIVVYTFFIADGYAREMKQDISGRVIRFHVIANSDTQEDQLLKLNVRDAVLAYMEPYLAESTSIEESRCIVTEHLEQITKVASVVVNNWEKDYKVTTELSTEHFPTKVYGDIALPQGDYEACRIVIGEGKGQNWWCVMYPPLCYVDAATGIMPEEGKEAIKGSLTEEEYEIIQFESDKPYQIRFKLLEWLGN